MNDMNIRLVQLPNGDWIDPRKILGVCSDAVVHKQTGEVGPAVIIVSHGGREIYWRVASDEDAKRERDETVRRLGVCVVGDDGGSGDSSTRMRHRQLADELDRLAERPYLIDCACAEVESSLIDMREDGSHVLYADYGVVIKDRDGKESCVMRMYFDEALRIALRRIAHQIRMGAKRDGVEDEKNEQ